MFLCGIKIFKQRGLLQEVFRGILERLRGVFKKMKRKYFFVILFLVLAIFFIINTSSVNAIMYKILDSEGNIIRITNNPILSIEEIEAGCKILSAPDESNRE